MTYFDKLRAAKEFLGDRHVYAVKVQKTPHVPLLTQWQQRVRTSYRTPVKYREP